LFSPFAAPFSGGLAFEDLLLGQNGETRLSKLLKPGGVCIQISDHLFSAPAAGLFDQAFQQRHQALRVSPSGLQQVIDMGAVHFWQTGTIWPILFHAI
jgi:hypothetical protein